VEEILDPNIALFTSGYIAKPPKEGQPVLWHQDGSYWPLEPIEAVTVWLTLTDVTVENDCMRVVPDTHTVALQEFEERDDVDNVFSSGMGDSAFDECDAVDIELSPGDLFIHHPNVIHGSNVNTSDVWRRGMMIRYISTGTDVVREDPFGQRQWVEDHPLRKLLLLRREPKPGTNQYIPWPHYDKQSGEYILIPDGGAYNRRAEEVNETIAESTTTTTL